MQLQTNRSLADAFRFGFAPIADQNTVQGEADPISLGKDFQMVPIVLFTNLAGCFDIFMNTVPTIEVVETMAAREHYEVSAVRERIAAFRRNSAPHRDARMHLALRELEVAYQAEIAEGLFGK